MAGDIARRQAEVYPDATPLSAAPPGNCPDTPAAARHLVRHRAQVEGARKDRDALHRLLDEDPALRASATRNREPCSPSPPATLDIVVACLRPYKSSHPPPPQCHTRDHQAHGRGHGGTISRPRRVSRRLQYHHGSWCAGGLLVQCNLRCSIPQFGRRVEKAFRMPACGYRRLPNVDFRCASSTAVPDVDPPRFLQDRRLAPYNDPWLCRSPILEPIIDWRSPPPRNMATSWATCRSAAAPAGMDIRTAPFIIKSTVPLAETQLRPSLRASPGSGDFQMGSRTTKRCRGAQEKIIAEARGGRRRSQREASAAALAAPPGRSI